MDAAPLSSAVAASPLAPIASKPLDLTAPPAVVAAWPRCAQLAAAFLLGGVTALLGVHVLASVRDGCEPVERESPLPLSYRVDLNEARRAELRQLPGVGPTLAERIEEYRQVNGGFRSVDELTKVPGIGRATLEKIRPFVFVGAVEKKVEAQPKQETKPAPPKKEPAANSKLAKLTGPIDVNHASLEELQKLPGIGPKLSQRMVDERAKKPFATVDELRRVPGIGLKTLEKLRPHVIAGK